MCKLRVHGALWDQFCGLAMFVCLSVCPRYWTKRFGHSYAHSIENNATNSVTEPDFWVGSLTLFYYQVLFWPLHSIIFRKFTKSKLSNFKHPNFPPEQTLKKFTKKNKLSKPNFDFDKKINLKREITPSEARCVSRHSPMSPWAYANFWEEAQPPPSVKLKSIAVYSAIQRIYYNTPKSPWTSWNACLNIYLNK